MTDRTGRAGEPIIELDIDPFSTQVLSDPASIYPAMFSAGSVFKLTAYGVYGVARHHAVTEVLRDWENFSSARGVGLSDYARDPAWHPPSPLLERDPPEHTRTRKIANRVLSIASLKSIRPDWALAADALIQALVAKGEFDGVTELAEIFPQRVFADALGLREAGRQNLVPYAMASFNAMGPKNEIFESTEPVRLSHAPWVMESCQRENVAPGSWGAALFEASDRGECSEAEAGGLMRSLLTAGFDTTINGIANTLDILADRPDVWKALQADRKLVPRAFEEALRLSSPVQLFFRTTPRDVAIDGCLIPADSKVLLFFGAANRDPKRWEDPDSFDLHRQTGGHLAFGYGVHHCGGQMTARQEVELILNALLDRAASLQRTGPTVRRLNNTLHAIASLPLAARPA